MTESELLAYRKRLLDAGIARSVVNRNIRELRDHRDDLTRAAQQQGFDLPGARADAGRHVGSAARLGDAMIACPELRGILHRHPIMLTVITPLLLMLVIYVLGIFLLIGIGSLMHFAGNAVVMPAPAWMAAVLSVSRVFLMHWLTPLCTLAFCHVAISAHVRVYYWMVCMFLLCLLGSTVNVHVSMPDPAYAREGLIGVSIGYPQDDSIGVLARLSANLLLCGAFAWYSLRRERTVEFA